MKITAVDLPLAEYNALLLTDRFSKKAADRVRAALNGWGPVAVFGSGQTGQAVRFLLGERFAGFIDSATLAEGGGISAENVVLATGPQHYPRALEALRQAGLGERPVAMLFSAGEELRIRLIIESQPRSGTHYTLDNMLKKPGIGFASVFQERGAQTTLDGLVQYIPGSFQQGYVVKAHFNRPLYYPAYRYAATMYLFGYFHDTYYSWGKLLSMDADKHGYRLKADSLEWSVLQGHLPLHLKWLDYVRDKFLVRYEDYFSDFENTVSRIERFSGLSFPDFEPPKPNPGRTYWSDNYDARMQSEVRDAITTAYAPFIARYYPEKAASLGITSQEGK